MDWDSDIEVDIKTEELDEATAEDLSFMCYECPTTLKNEKASLRHGLKNSKSLVGEFKLQETKALLDLFNAKNLRPK